MLPLPKDRNLYLNKQVDQASMGDLTQKIIDINENDLFLTKLYNAHDIDYVAKPIKIYIDSPGGTVYNCFGVLSVIENSKTPIHTIVTGHAMSCAFMILICGHKRFAHKLSTPLYHQVSGGAFGTLKDMEDRLVEVKRLQKTLEDITIQKTAITAKKLKEIYNEKTDWYMTAEEALSLKVVDEII